MSYKAFLTTSMLTISLLGSISFAEVATSGFMEAVNAYRSGHYRQAEELLTPLHDQAPDKTQITYYLALCKTQLGDFQGAKALYQEVMALDPSSHAAKLSSIGLKQLGNVTDPKNGFQMDLPPDFSGSAANTHSASSPSTPASPSAETAENNGGMSPQEMMMMQMVMGNMGGNNNSQGLNPMMMYGLAGQPNAQGQPNGIDPNVLSTMMMNQMLQNFSLEGKQNNND